MPENRGPVTSAVTIVVTVIATVFVAARFFTRIWLVKRIRQDDWWMLAAWVCSVGFSVSICVAVHFGLGKHKVNIPDSSFGALRKAEYTFAILYNPSLMLTKTSIIVFFLSVMSQDVDRIFKWCNWLTLAVVNIVGLALTFFNVFQCSPVAAGYEYPTQKDAKCADIVTLYLSSAPVNIITDIAILFLPIPILTGMRLPKKQKIILVATFSCGAFVAIVDVIRIAYLQQASLNRLNVVKDGKGGQPRIVEQNDFSWYASLSFMWSAVEVCLGIICACVPSLKPLFARFLPSFIKNAGEEVTMNDSMDSEKSEQGGPNIDLPRGNVSVVNNPAAFRKPMSKEYSGDDEGEQMGFLNMLAGPPEAEQRSSSSLTRKMTKLSRRATNKSAVSNFGFVKISGTRNMLKLSNRESAWPIAIVTVIFFLWGFAYGLLDTLNSRFQVVAGISNGKALGLHSAYYGGYFIGPLTLGRFILKRYGFRASMIAGLAVYGCGTLVFWPSAVLTSYAAFTVSNFIVGFGLSCLETAANPFIALCGPLEYAEVRLNLSQAFQAIGTVCSPLLATKVLFKSVNSAGSLVDVQWTYLGISLFVFALAVVFYYIPLPEATDEQLEDMAERRSDVYDSSIGPWKTVYITLGLGVFSQFCYVGAQECVGNNLQELFSLLRPNARLHPFDYETVAHGVFALGRFLAAFLNYFFRPRWLLLAFYVGMVICLGLSTTLSGTGGAAVGVLTFFFEAGIFSIIFAIVMRGLGRHTKTGASFMAAAISGGGVFPPIQWAVMQHQGLKKSYSVPLAVACFGTIFALYLNFFPTAQRQVDPTHQLRRKERNGNRTDSIVSSASGATIQGRASDFGLPGMIARHIRNKRSESPTVQHVERRSTKLNMDGNSGSDVLAMDFAGGEKGTFTPHPSKLDPVKFHTSKDHVADLALWPVKEDTPEESASASSNETGGGRASKRKSNGISNWSKPDTNANNTHMHTNGELHIEGELAIPRHRPRSHWEGDDPDLGLDDYHAIVRRI